MSTTSSPPFRSLPVLQALLIIAATFWIYSPIYHGGWLWDDGLLIRDNRLVHDPAGLSRIWTEPGSLIDYQPVTVSVEWLEWHLWHDNTLGFHLVSIGLHALGSLLVWNLLAKFNLRLAWLGGLLFAVHPAVVESVAWMSELKNTLSLPPFLLAMCAWIDFDRTGRWGNYLLALGLFLVAMLCKASMVMFPFVILLYAWWRRGRIGWRDLLNAAPFFIVSFVLGLVTLAFLHPAMGLKTIPLGDPLTRIALAGTSLIFYFLKCFWPVGLLPIYPKWIIAPGSLLSYAPWLIVLIIGILCWRKRTSWGKHLALGLGFFLINLLPFLGFTWASYMSFTWVMDHVLYIPLIGLIGLAIAGCELTADRMPAALHPLGVAALSFLLIVLAVESHMYARIFVSQEQLWTHTLQANPDSDVAHSNLGLVYLNRGEYPRAAKQFSAALALNPDYAYAHNGLGNALVAMGEPAEAMTHYREALRINPGYPEAHNGVANLLLQAGQLDEAQAECETVIKLNPHYADAYCNLGLIYAQHGKVADAIVQFEIADKLSPGDTRIRHELDILHALQSGKHGNPPR